MATLPTDCANKMIHALRVHTPFENNACTHTTTQAHTKTAPHHTDTPLTTALSRLHSRSIPTMQECRTNREIAFPSASKSLPRVRLRELCLHTTPLPTSRCRDKKKTTRRRLEPAIIWPTAWELQTNAECRALRQEGHPSCQQMKCINTCCY